MDLPISFYFWFLFFCFFLASILVPFTIRIKIANWRKDNGISLEIKFLFFAVQKTVFLRRLSAAPYHIASQIDSNTLVNGIIFFNRQLKILKWKHLILKIKIGDGNPYDTALIAGSLLGVSGFLSRYLETHYSFKKRPSFFIYPSFTAKMFYFDLFLEFKAGALRLLYIGTYLAAFLLAGRCLKNAGASNPRLNENSHGEFKRNGGC